MTAEKAINTICNTSERTWEGTIYTFADQRFPDYMGKQVIVTLEAGKSICRWVKK